MSESLMISGKINPRIERAWMRSLIYSIVEDQPNRGLDLELFEIMDEVYQNTHLSNAAVFEIYVKALVAWAISRRLFPAATDTPKVKFFLANYSLFGMTS